MTEARPTRALFILAMNRAFHEKNRVSEDPMCDRLKRSVVRVITAMIVATASCAIEAATVLSTEVVDLRKTPIQGLPRSLKVNLYKDADWTGKHALVVLVPKFGAYLSDSPYREQAEYFVKAGYVAAVPRLDIYNNGANVPVYESRLEPDLATDTTPVAIEVLALVAALSQPTGPANSKHVIVGEGFGSIVAARYATLGVSGCKGVILFSPGFTEGNTASLIRASEDAYRQLGAKVAVPSLWLYARGNMRVRETTVNEFFAAFKSGNSMASLVILPEIGMDGDQLFPKANIQSTWGEPVSRFLGTLDLR